MSSFIEEEIAEEQARRERGPVYARWRDLLAGEFEASGVPLNSTSLAFEATRIVKAGAGLLFGVSGFSSNVAAQFIQIHDSASIPADGAVPVVIVHVTAATNFSMDWVFPGRFFNRGIVICNSSTGPTKTVGAADCWFDANYI